MTSKNVIIDIIRGARTRYTHTHTHLYEAQGGSKWFKLAQGGSKWLKVAQYESRWLKVPQSGSEMLVLPMFFRVSKASENQTFLRLFLLPGEGSLGGAERLRNPIYLTYTLLS